LSTILLYCGHIKLTSNYEWIDERLPNGLQIK